MRSKFNIVEFFVVNFICVRLFAVGNYYAIDCLHLTCKFGFEFHWDVKHLFYKHDRIHNEKFNYIKFWCDLNIVIRIPRFIEYVLRSTLSYPNETLNAMINPLVVESLTVNNTTRRRNNLSVYCRLTDHRTKPGTAIQCKTKDSSCHRQSSVGF
jgi:hypothetical protein